MEGSESSYEWELSKENVQPLKQGRKFANLSAALQPNSADRLAQVKEERRAFELELRTYTGEDPLSVWYGYITWIEQNYPKGGCADISTLLEQCVCQFKDEEKYRNDQRYLEVWIKYAHMCSEPREIFNFMFNNELCSGLAAFYEAWASELEAQGSMRLADSVYQQGMSRHAEPLNWLQNRHREFQARIAVLIASGELEQESTASNENGENRMALGQLKGQGRAKKVGSVRSSTAKPAVLGNSASAGRSHSSSNCQTPTFTIFQDQENSTSTLPPQSHEWAKVPTKSQVNRENERKPGKWSDAKIRQRLGSVHSTPTSQPAFQIHVDSDTPQPVNTPCRVRPEVSSVLSARKPDKKPDPIRNLLGSSSGAPDTGREGSVSGTGPKQVPMYCKHLVYKGIEEFSLEEIRAAHFIKKEEEQRHKQLEEERLFMQEQIRRQREELAALVQQKLSVQQQSQQSLVDTSAAAQSAELMDTSELPVASQQPTQDPAVSDSLRQVSQKNTGGVSSSRGNVSRTCGDSGSSSFVAACSVQGNVSRRGNLYNEGTHSSSLTDASPTVNTKDAMRMVMGMFNQTLTVGCVDEHRPSQPSKSSDLLAAPPSLPFTVFVDEDSHVPTKSDEDIEDTENRAPSGYKCGPRRKNLAGILQPSKDIDIQPLDDKGDEKEEVAMDDDNEEVLAQRLYGSETEPMDALSDGATGMLGDITSFVPCFSSTRNFSELTRQAAAASSIMPDMPVSTGRPSICPTTEPSIYLKDESPAVYDGSSVKSIRSGACEKTSDETLTTSLIQRRQVIPPTAAAENSVSNPGRATTSHSTLEPSLSVRSTAADESSTRAQPLASMNQTCHEVDISNYVAASDEDPVSARDALSQSIMVNPYSDPFDADLIEDFLDKLDRPIEAHPTYHRVPGNMPSVKVGGIVEFGGKRYKLVSKLGEGAYAKVYELHIADGKNTEQRRVVKIQNPPCPWEFYIVTELHHRLKQLSLSKQAFMKIDSAYFFNNSSCLVSELLPHGNLLDVVNQLKVRGSQMAEPLKVLLTIDLLRILESLVSAQIIHGDVKPDNFLFRGFPEMEGDAAQFLRQRAPCLQLIDFGRSIDMRMFPPGTSFTVGVNTSGFQCIEMRTNRPWTYQTDMFGVVGTVNVIVFGDYMKVRLDGGRWKTNSLFKRWFKSQAAMRKLYDELLNVTSCEQLPDVSALRHQLEQDFIKLHSNQYNSKVAEFKVSL